MKEVPPNVKDARLHRLLALASELKGEYERAHIGKALELVPEERRKGYTEGYSENYIRLYVAGGAEGRTRVRAVGAFKDGLLAEIIR